MSVSKSLLRYRGFVLSVTTARVVGTILTAATFPYLVRRLGVDMYGLWSYVVAVCGFTGRLANPGLSRPRTLCDQLGWHRPQLLRKEVEGIA